MNRIGRFLTKTKRPATPSRNEVSLTRLTLALVLAVSATWADAGALRKALTKELAARVTTRQLATRAERDAYKGILRELDEQALQSIEKRFGGYIPREALVHARRNPSNYLDQESYRLWLHKAYPKASAEDLRGVIGDTHPLTKRATVDRNQVTLANTVAHERLHQLSHTRFGKSFGRSMNEGTTDYFAARVSGDLHLIDTRVGYPDERVLANMIAARVGEAPLARAYFQGDFAALGYALERDLGAGSFTALQRHLQREDIKAARVLLSGK